MRNIYRVGILIGMLGTLTLTAQNQPEREAWLRDAGFGMFIHWSVDAQLGTVISHSLVGASEDYTRRYFEELPKTFDPQDADPDRWARLAKLAGMKYMVLTAKHHSGFCLWHTETTDFSIEHTPYQRDFVAEYVKACRKYGLAVGLYFSPEDFHYLHQQGELIKRGEKGDRPAAANERYIAFVKAQMKELLAQYGPIDVLFFDGKKNFLIDALKPYCWSLKPDVLITRGEIETPEQHLLGVASDRVWEACMTMGTQWQFKPTNESYKPASQVIQLLAETRAQGGALLLNIGPDGLGELPFEQERNLTELAAWYFINHEAIDGVEPWPVTHEGDIWYTKARDEDVVYAILGGQEEWPRGERREFLLHAVAPTEKTKISVLGQSDKWVEYMPEVDATSRFRKAEKGIEVSVVRAQRIYNNHRWPNPVVIKLEHVRPAFIPPAIRTLPVAADGHLQGELLSLGDEKSVQAGFQYRLKPKGLNDITKHTDWKELPAGEFSKTGAFSLSIPDWSPGRYQIRAFVKHDYISIEGAVEELLIP
ncbi:alpha-L-fucosidase [Phaeodactylibacter xiamenensis]|uniref:alpha-L-fucosidase n=1 Tax=Phaeodactylibacter xiamenensis TaxID=1524460 RepID=UPI003CCC2097